MKIYRVLFDGIKEDVVLKCVKFMLILSGIPDFMIILSEIPNHLIEFRCI